MNNRTLGQAVVAPLGLGCMRLSSGGWFHRDGKEIDFGPTDDEQSVCILREALDHGVTLFDTASLYGCGHNETLLGKALAGRREEAVIVSKAGGRFDEQGRRILDGHLLDGDPRAIKTFCEGSLRRLGTDYIDVYLLHTFYQNDDLDLDKAAGVRDAMEELVAEGKLRGYGWSTDWPHQIAVFAEGEHCVCTEQDLNIFAGNAETLTFCEEHGLASLCRSPLAQGAFAPKPNRDGLDDRGGGEANLKKLDAIRDILCSDGRTIIQGALAWLWGRSAVTIPIPGFRTREQMLGLAGALEHGPLTPGQMAEIENVKQDDR